jgi:hypothetical protein
MQTLSAFRLWINDCQLAAVFYIRNNRGSPL